MAANESAGFFHRLSVRRGWRQPVATGFVLRPDPLTIGSITRGRQIMAGHLNFAGHVVELSHGSLWAEPAPDAAFDAVRHGFEWLDDLAALASPAARRKARGWLWEWIEDNRSGQGIGWQSGLAGRRLLRWVFHAPFLMRGTSPEEQLLFLRAVSAHLWHLSRRGPRLEDGLPKIEALTGLIVGALCLEDRASLAEAAIPAFVTALGRLIDDHGGLASRNPESLLTLAMHVNWVQEALKGADMAVPPRLAGARDAIALTLRSLRHADGSLPRFHGGGAGAEGALDRVLQASPLQTRRSGRSAMGYARLSARRTSLILDASPPPGGIHAVTGHASTLAFELTSGRRPIIVNCGPGDAFGPDWRRAARSTAGHSVLCFEGYSSAQMGVPDPATGLEPLTGAPGEVLCDMMRLDKGDRVQALHKGYSPSHGLTHSRLLELSHDGRHLTAEDRLVVASDRASKRFARVLAQNGGALAFHIRFHLHPDVVPSLSDAEDSASLALASGEVWLFSGSRGTVLSIEPSVYLDPDQMVPRATKQVVLSGRAMKYATSIQWSLSKSEDTELAVRDAAWSDEDPYS